MRTNKNQKSQLLGIQSLEHINATENDLALHSPYSICNLKAIESENYTAGKQFQKYISEYNASASLSYLDSEVLPGSNNKLNSRLLKSVCDRTSVYSIESTISSIDDFDYTNNYSAFYDDNIEHKKDCFQMGELLAGTPSSTPSGKITASFLSLHSEDSGEIDYIRPRIHSVSYLNEVLSKNDEISVQNDTKSVNNIDRMHNNFILTDEHSKERKRRSLPLLHANKDDEKDNNTVKSITEVNTITNRIAENDNKKLKPKEIINLTNNRRSYIPRKVGICSSTTTLKLPYEDNMYLKSTSRQASASLAKYKCDSDTTDNKMRTTNNLKNERNNRKPHSTKNVDFSHSIQETNSTIEEIRKYDGSRIAIVDDNAVNVILLAAMLRKHLQIIVPVRNFFNNGLQLITAMTIYKFDLIFLDIVMPVLDGCSTTIKIRSKLKPDVEKTNKLQNILANEKLNRQIAKSSLQLNSNSLPRNFKETKNVTTPTSGIIMAKEIVKSFAQLHTTESTNDLDSDSDEELYSNEVLEDFNFTKGIITLKDMASDIRTSNQSLTIKGLGSPLLNNDFLYDTTKGSIDSQVYNKVDYRNIPDTLISIDDSEHSLEKNSGSTEEYDEEEAIIKDLTSLVLTTTNKESNNDPSKGQESKILRSNWTAPIIAVTSNASSDEIELYQRIGVNGVIEKPIKDPNQFVEYVKVFLDLRRMWRIDRELKKSQIRKT